MSDGLLLSGLISLMMLCFIGLIFCGIAQEEADKKYYIQCLSEGENKWTCESALNSKKTLRSAQSASITSGIAMSMALGRR